MKHLHVAIAIACVTTIVGHAGEAAAQNRLLPGRLEVGFAVVGTAALDLGTSDAEQTTPQGGTLTLFETSTRLQPAAGLEARFGVALSRTFQIDGFASYAQSDLRTRVSDDEENAPNVTLAEAVKQIGVGGALTLHFPGWSAQSRTIPFLSLGGSYLRELHDGQTLVDEGYSYQFGGGVKVLLGGGTAARPTGIGIRADVRAVMRSGGIAFDDEPTLVPSAAAGVFLRF